MEISEGCIRDVAVYTHKYRIFQKFTMRGYCIVLFIQKYINMNKIFVRTGSVRVKPHIIWFIWANGQCCNLKFAVGWG